ncbi:MAG TPA: hypothetical protein IAC82_12275 [Candidatus Merdivicinus intestinigallinarum]|nr:hypothetical protein [Candidatus Merdivicinus intestinigallinarum]
MDHPRFFEKNRVKLFFFSIEKKVEPFYTANLFRRPAVGVGLCGRGELAARPPGKNQIGTPKEVPIFHISQTYQSRPAFF